MVVFFLKKNDLMVGKVVVGLEFIEANDITEKEYERLIGSC